MLSLTSIIPLISLLCHINEITPTETIATAIFSLVATLATAGVACYVAMRILEFDKAVQNRGTVHSPSGLLSICQALRVIKIIRTKPRSTKNQHIRRSHSKFFIFGKTSFHTTSITSERNSASTSHLTARPTERFYKLPKVPRTHGMKHHVRVRAVQYDVPGGPVGGLNCVVM